MTQILQKRGNVAKQEKADNVTELLLKCIVEGLPLNMARKAESSGAQVYTTKNGQVVHIHPSSILHPSQRRLLRTDKSSYERGLNPDVDCRCVLYSEVV